MYLIAVRLPVRQVVNVHNRLCRQEAFELPVGADQEKQLRILTERFAALQRAR